MRFHQRHIPLGSRGLLLSSDPEDRLHGFYDTSFIELAAGDPLAMLALRQLHLDHHPAAAIRPPDDHAIIEQVKNLVYTGRICMLAAGQIDGVEDGVIMALAPTHSGAAWWHANEASYPNSTKISDLASPFRGKVEEFLKALDDAEAEYSISTTRRNKARAAIMHYSWLVAKGGIKPAKVPKIEGVTLEWDHGNLKKSQAEAAVMVKLFGMKDQAVLDSNHISGNAIDVTITWSGTLKIKDAKDKEISIGSPRNGGDNKTLHTVGASYGVIKLVKVPPDDPHWSYNGR